MGLEFARQLTAREATRQFGTTSARRGCSNLSPPRDGVPRMQKLRTPLVAAQGYQRFPLSRPVVGQNIALDAVPAYRASMPT